MKVLLKLLLILILLCPLLSFAEENKEIEFKILYTLSNGDKIIWFDNSSLENKNTCLYKDWEIKNCFTNCNNFYNYIYVNETEEYLICDNYEFDIHLYNFSEDKEKSINKAIYDYLYQYKKYEVKILDDTYFWSIQGENVNEKKDLLAIEILYNSITTSDTYMAWVCIVDINKFNNWLENSVKCPIITSLIPHLIFEEISENTWNINLSPLEYNRFELTWWNWDKLLFKSKKWDFYYDTISWKIISEDNSSDLYNIIENPQNTQINDWHIIKNYTKVFLIEYKNWLSYCWMARILLYCLNWIIEMRKNK